MESNRKLSTLLRCYAPVTWSRSGCARCRVQPDLLFRFIVPLEHVLLVSGQFTEFVLEPFVLFVSHLDGEEGVVRGHDDFSACFPRISRRATGRWVLVEHLHV